MTKTEFDPSTLINRDLVSPMLTAAASDPQKLIVVISQLAKVVGMSEVASRAGVGSLPSLYRSLKEGAEPRYSTVAKILDALGYRIVIEPKPPEPAAALSNIARARKPKVKA